MENIEKKIEEEVLVISNQTKDVVIKTEEDYIGATEMLKQIKSKSKEVESFFKEIKDNAYASWKAICNKEKLHLEPLSDAEKVLKSAMVGYQQKLDIERKRLEEEENKKRAKEVAKLEKQGKSEEAELLSSQTVELVETTYKVSGVSYQVDYEVIVKDETKVPVSLNGIVLRPIDLSVVKKLAKDSKGKVLIEGIEIKETKIAKVRV